MFIQHLGIIILLWARVSTAADEEPCGNTADIAFILDSSVSIAAKNFEIEKQFVKSLVEQFDVNPTKTQVAALQFAQSVFTEFHFNKYDNKDDVIQRVGQITQSFGAATYTDKALTAMQTGLFNPANGARKGVPRIAILISDGNSTNPWKTLSAADAAKQAGITILAVGISDKVNKEELEKVVTQPAKDNFFFVGDFEDLNDLHFQKLVGQQACKRKPMHRKLIPTTTTETPMTTITTPLPDITTTEMQKEEPDSDKKCQGKEADVVFVLDMSSSIWSEDFKQQLMFVTKVIDSFDVESGKTKIGALSFSDDANVVFDLNEYDNHAEINKAVLGIVSKGGITNTHKALDVVTDRMFNPDYGSRSGVAHICILITDGRSSVPQETLKRVQKIHDRGIYLFAIGVGNMTDGAELAQMASRPTEEYLFQVNGYNALPKIQNLLAYKTCEVPQGDQPRSTCDGKLKADVMFGLYNISDKQRDHVTMFLQKVGGILDLDTGSSVGLSDSCVSRKIKISKFSSTEEFRYLVDSAMATGVSDMLYRMRHSFPRKSAIDRFAVLLIAGDIPDINRAKVEAMRLKFSSRVIVIGIGNDVSRDQLIDLASYRPSNRKDISHVFPLDSPDDLLLIVGKLFMLMCIEEK